MRSKLFVAALLVAAVGTAGVAYAQDGPTVMSATLKKDDVKYFNYVASGNNIIDIQAIFRTAGVDADIMLFDGSDDSREPEDAFATFNSLANSYEAAKISVVNGTTVVICVVNVSGPKSKFDMVVSILRGANVNVGDVRMGGGGEITEGGEFGLYGPVEPGMEGIQAAIQRMVEAKRR